MGRDGQKCNVFKIAKMTTKTNQDISAEQYTRNDDGLLAVKDKD